MNYDVNYFIDKFEAIPAKDWTVSVQQDDQGRRCAFGHCADIGAKYNGYGSNGGDETKEGVELDKVFSVFTKYNAVADINNGKDHRYQQPTPKQRILAALYDIKKMQDPAVIEPPKTRIERVAIPVSITKDFNPVLS